MHQHLAVAVIFVSIALVISGCGGGGSSVIQNGGDPQNGDDEPDPPPPSVSLVITSPNESAYIEEGSVQTISADASASAGVDRVEFIVDGAPIGTDSSAPYSWSWNTTGYSVGSHAITVTVYDRSVPAYSTSRSVNVYVVSLGGPPPPPPI